MKQPKLSFNNAQIEEKYKELLTIKEGQVASPVFIALIGDPYLSSNLKHRFIPVTIVQRRKDISQASQTTAADKFFRGWTGFEQIVRHTENVVESIFQANGFKEGMIIEKANLAVDYALEPFYEGQEPVINPRTEEVVTSGGEPIYRNTRIEFGPVVHTGLDIARDQTELSAVSESISLQDDESTF